MSCLHSNKGVSTSETLTKKARSKYVSNKLAVELAWVAEGYHEIRYYDKGLKQSVKASKKKSDIYFNTWHCSSKMEQHGQKITSRYCNNRWCITCNRIRTAKLIHGYYPTLQEWTNKYFLTLTIQNVKAEVLAESIKEMHERFRDIKKDMAKRERMKFKALRKFECTYNEKRDDYHPHFHFIIDSEVAGQKVIEYWCRRYGERAASWSQDLRVADDNSVMELFKYFTKIFKKDNTGGFTAHVKPLYNMFEAMRGMRTFQPMGIRKISEDVEEIQSQVFDIEEQETFWRWFENDWYSEDTGEALTSFSPSEVITKLITAIK